MVTYFYFPETRRMTIEEIAEIFEGTTPLKGTMKKYTTAGEIEIEDGTKKTAQSPESSHVENV